MNMNDIALKMRAYLPENTEEVYDPMHEEEDVLSCPAPLDRFPAIMACPPFSRKWEPDPDDPRWKGPGVLAPKNNANWAYIQHCLYMLAENGTAVILSPAGVLFHIGPEETIRKWFIKNRHIETVEYFQSVNISGISIPAAILVLKKSRKSSDVTIKQGDQEKTFSLKDIRRNYFSLYPLHYEFKQKS